MYSENDAQLAVAPQGVRISTSLMPCLHALFACLVCLRRVGIYLSAIGDCCSLPPTSAWMLQVAELKDELTRRGLDTKGLKAELVQPSFDTLD